MSLYFREPMNGFTHFIGFCLAIAGLVLLLDKSLHPFNMMHVITFSVFGGGMILLYLASTLYHWLPLSAKGQACMRKVDHSMIFIYIAATYTPICLVGLKGTWGWSLFICIWAMAAGGIITKLFWMHAPRWLSTGFYLAMGWLAIVGIWPLMQALQTGALFWLVAGGFFYSIGAIIYALKRPNLHSRVLNFHEIFHIFVILGSLSHFWVMYKYISVMS